MIGDTIMHKAENAEGGHVCIFAKQGDSFRGDTAGKRFSLGMGLGGLLL